MTCYLPGSGGTAWSLPSPQPSPQLPLQPLPSTSPRILKSRLTRGPQRGSVLHAPSLECSHPCQITALLPLLKSFRLPLAHKAKVGPPPGTSHPAPRTVLLSLPICSTHGPTASTGCLCSSSNVPWSPGASASEAFHSPLPVHFPALPFIDFPHASAHPSSQKKLFSTLLGSSRQHLLQGAFPALLRHC